MPGCSAMPGCPALPGCSALPRCPALPKSKKTPLCISGAARYTLTAYAGLIQIGCKRHTISEWEQVFEKRRYHNEAESSKAYAIYRQMFEFAREWLKDW